MPNRTKTKFCSFCGTRNYEDADVCERCKREFPMSDNKPDDKLTGDNKFKYICPFKFHDMRRKMPEQFDDLDLTDFLVYEVFELSDIISFTDFLNKIGLGDLGFDTVKDKIYERAWKGIEGNSDERFLLYPANDRSNRLNDKDESSTQNIKNFDRSKHGEVSVILQKIEESEDYSYEKICVRGYDNDKTYSYNIIDEEYGEVLFTVRPCCPRCRTLLPDNWFSKAVHAYVPIALIASKSSGKTTYMTSLLDDVFTYLLKGLGATEWQVIHAIAHEEERFGIQSTRYGNYKRLKEEGLYPIPTESVMPPVCLTIRKLEDGNKIVSQIVVGIFDCAGEKYDPRKDVSDADLEFLNSMQSFIYLVEPKQMKGINYKFLLDKEFDPASILSSEEQGKMQKENMGYINAGDIIKSTSGSEEVVDIFNMMVGINNRLTANNSNLQHIAYTIVKSDELKNYKDDWGEVDGMDELLQPRAENKVLNKNVFYFIDDVVKEFFEKIVLDPQTAKSDIEFFESVGGSNVSKSWHCVSVARELPKNKQNNGKECEFFPVRITEPFVRCVVEKMKSLGLIDW